MLPRNFTGADFSALTSESYMIAVKERISQVQEEIEKFKLDKGIPQDDQLLPETYFSLKFADDPAKQVEATQVLIKQNHMEKALSEVTPSISI